MSVTDEPPGIPWLELGDFGAGEVEEPDFDTLRLLTDPAAISVIVDRHVEVEVDPVCRRWETRIVRRPNRRWLVLLHPACPPTRRVVVAVWATLRRLGCTRHDASARVMGFASVIDGGENDVLLSKRGHPARFIEVVSD